MINAEVNEKMLAFFKDRLDIDIIGSNIDPDTNFFESGLIDSLSFLVIINQIKKLFKVKVGLDDVDSINSFNKTVEFISSKI